MSAPASSGRRPSRRGSKLAAAAACAFLLLSAGASRADDASPRRSSGSPYRLKWTYDSALVALGAAGTMTAAIGHPKPACYPTCQPPTNMLGIDDASVGNYSPQALGLANVVVFGLVLAPMVINAADSRFDGWLEDSFVSLQAVLLSSAITQVMKSAVSRPAPLVYNPIAEQSHLDSPDAFRSFISGHSSTAFAAATSYSVTFWKRHPTSPWRFVVLGVSEALAASVSLLKVRAGYHYTTDVAAGALVGAAMGLFVPVLHSDW